MPLLINDMKSVQLFRQWTPLLADYRKVWPFPTESVAAIEKNGEQRFVSIIWIAHIEQELRLAQVIGAAQAATRR